MPRIITVKGIGKASSKPDYVVISMNLESRDLQYDRAMEKATIDIKLINEALESCGFKKDSVKTSNLNVNTDYESVHQDDGFYKRVFNGFVVNHYLKVEFDFESKRLTKALSAISSCLAHPKLDIAFKVKDPTALNEEMLRSATFNARRKAEILCEAAGVKLGELISIDYNWGELQLYSNTRCDLANESITGSMAMKSFDIEPESVELNDTVTFVWVLAG